MLRGYQQAAVTCALDWAKYKDNPAIIVLPTGAGKTHCINALIEAFHRDGLRVLLLAHRKELLEQAGKIITVPFGFYSASIGEKDLSKPVTVANIQSIYNIDTPPFDRIIIDECHRVPNSQDGQYWTLINKHPSAKIFALTATPFRLKGGQLAWGEVVYQIGYDVLLKNGYLCPLVNKVKSPPDISKVQIVAGDYSSEQLEEVMVDAELLMSSVKAIIGYSKDRNSVLIFCVSVRHAELLKNVMAANGLESSLVSGETTINERDAIIDGFKSGKIKYLLNCEVLLEGFDSPNIDMIVCLRPTQSKALWEQLIGRGVRLHPSKQNCLVLDMGGNLERHGGLGVPFPKKKGSKKEIAPVYGKICPSCETFVGGVNTRACPDCGFEFPELEARKVDHDGRPNTGDNVSMYYDTATPKTDWHEVGIVGYSLHKSKTKGTLSIRVSYDIGYQTVNEWLSPFSESPWARNRCHQYFINGGVDLGGDAAVKLLLSRHSKEDVLNMLVAEAQKLKKPSHVKVDYSKNEKYGEVKAVRYDTAEGGSGNTKGAAAILEEMDDFIQF